jgi:hypothetical protein
MASLDQGTSPTATGSLTHVPTFTPSLLPLGWERCRTCNGLLDLYRWAATVCPGRPVEELR